MSATGRGTTRRDRDAYYTPEWCVRAIIPTLEEIFPCGPERVLEPSAGDGRILDIITLHFTPYMVFGIDIIKGDHPSVVHGDYLCAGVLPIVDRADLIITNPPFSKSFEFAQKAVQEARVVCMLLRLNWLASKKRSAWLRKNTPSVFVLPKRPSFTGNGTDSCDYAWVIWGDQRGPRVQILEVEP